MQEPVAVSQRTADARLLDFVMRTPRWFFTWSGGLGLVFMLGAVVFLTMLYWGLEFLGYAHPVYWGFLIVNFVFWIGISHAGVFVSAILRLTHAEFRRPVTRAAEVLTIFSLQAAVLFPLIHSGRPWRTAYWAFPYDFIRGMWPNPRSPLVWDPAAIFTYLTSTILFVYVALLPDLALARDRSQDPIRRFLFSVLALGFKGSTRQWRIQAIAGILLSAIILPIFVSVHSIVSWDFAVTSVPGWHNTVFAPYFVIGAVHSGVSAVVTTMIVMKWAFKLGDFITRDHLDALARLLIAVATGWIFFLFLDFAFGLYGLEPTEVDTWQRRVFEWPFPIMVIILLLSAYVIPVPLWLFRAVRRSYGWMFFTTILVNVGMWLERYILIVPALERKSSLTFSYSTYIPSISEVILVIASFAFVMVGVLVFAKVLPIMPAVDIKEGMILTRKMQIGRVQVPATVRE